MIEHIFIKGELVHTGERPACSGFTFPFAYIFYDVQTGEPWGQRICVSDEPAIYRYIPQEYPLVALPFEEEQCLIPANLLSYYLNYLEKKYGSTPRL